jgi:hypothetical protein
MLFVDTEVDSDSKAQAEQDLSVLREKLEKLQDEKTELQAKLERKHIHSIDLTPHDIVRVITADADAEKILVDVQMIKDFAREAIIIDETVWQPSSLRSPSENFSNLKNILLDKSRSKLSKQFPTLEEAMICDQFVMLLLNTMHRTPHSGLTFIP